MLSRFIDWLIRLPRALARTLRQELADFPEIYQMQIRAILEAAAECQNEGIEVHPKIKVPQVCTAQDLKIVKQWVDFSREDAENKFLPLYTQSGVLQDDPFEVLDEKGVGKLMELAVQWGRSVKSDLLVGICGEHGGHPAAIAFCDKIAKRHDFSSFADLRTVDEVGENESHPLASLLEIVGVLIKRYEDCHVPELEESGH